MSTVADWVQQAISKLLTDSHIHFPSGLPLGPGPIDVFSTDFEQTFTSNVKANVAGRSEDFDGLKKKFLVFRQRYDPEKSEFIQLEWDGSPGVDGSIVKLLLKGVTKEGTSYEIIILSVVITTDGEKKISDIDLQGPADLFKD